MPDAEGREIEVPKVRTTPAEPELCEALCIASCDLLGQPLSREAMGVLVAQIYLETGRLRSCFNYNLGNVRDLPGDGFDYVMLYTWEMLPDGKGGTYRWEGYGAFRAMPDLFTGVLEHLRFLTDFSRRPRYRDVWTRVLAGDARGTAFELKKRGYYTADENDYARAMDSIMREFMAKTAHVDLTPSLPAWKPTDVPAHARPLEPLIGNPWADAQLFTVADVLDAAAVDDLRASLVRGYHRPTHVVDVLPRLAESEDLARIRRQQFAQSRGSIG